MAVVGVLALQGSYNEHMAALRRIGVRGVEVRKPEQLLGVDSLIIPDSESTTMAKLANYHNLNPANKREIICDSALKSLFGGRDKVGIMEIAKLLSPHFLKN